LEFRVWEWQLETVMETFLLLRQWLNNCPPHEHSGSGRLIVMEAISCWSMDRFA